MKLIQILLAAFAALVFSSCGNTGGAMHVQVPGGTMVFGNPNAGMYAEGGHSGPPGARRHPGDGHGGPPGSRPEPRLVKGGKAHYSESKWQNGVDRHELFVRATISARNGALTMEERPALGKQLEDWAKTVYDDSGKTHVPTDEEATAKLREMLGHDNVRVKITHNQTDKFIPQERTLISRERVEEKDVPRESVAELQSKAIEQFKQKGTNDMVTDGRYHDKL